MVINIKTKRVHLIDVSSFSFLFFHDIIKITQLSINIQKQQVLMDNKLI